jgi:hypothetical protein
MHVIKYGHTKIYVYELQLSLFSDMCDMYHAWEGWKMYTKF